MPGPTSVIVSTTESSDSYPITSKTTGKALLDEVLARYGLPPIPLFNIQYTDKKDDIAFLKPEKKILSIDYKKDKSNKSAPIQMAFRCQYFPESVNEELTQATIQRLFWHQIREQLVKDEIYCPSELCVLFAGQTLQAFHGDVSPSISINPSELLPVRVLDQHSFTPEQWSERIRNAWNEQKGFSREQAVLDFLNVAQDLEQYGVTYFEVHNKKGTKLWLGVHNLGMDIYEYKNKVTPRLGFPWTEIRNISFNDKKFTIKMVAKDSPDFKFYSVRFKQNKRILALCVGNHQFYVARRRAQASGMGIREDRAAIEAKIRRTKDLLLKIRQDLETVKDVTKITKEDQIHIEQEKSGMDKFKTMKKAQSGDARQRVQDFENLQDEEDC